MIHKRTELDALVDRFGAVGKGGLGIGTWSM